MDCNCVFIQEDDDGTHINHELNIVYNPDYHHFLILCKFIHEVDNLGWNYLA